MFFLRRFPIARCGQSVRTAGPQLEHGGETDIVIFVQFLSGAYGAIVILFLLRLLAECPTPPHLSKPSANYCLIDNRQI